MKYSIIVPVYNAQRTLDNCLKAIFAAVNDTHEVIVVDDKSTDRSGEIIKRYPCLLISLDARSQAAGARNAGSKKARGQILIFIDSDVIIHKDTLGVIEAGFERYPDIVAMTGMLTRYCPHHDFFSQYKNAYMRFVLKDMPLYVDFLYGSICAIRAANYLLFNESLQLTDDTELGRRYAGLSHKVMFNPALEVTHDKKYSFYSLLRNDFFVPFWWSKSFVLHRGMRDVVMKGRFSHARLWQLIGIAVMACVALLCFGIYIPTLRTIQGALLVLFFSLHVRFFRFLLQEKGVWFLARAVPFSCLDALVMAAGAGAGIVYFTYLRVFLRK